MNNYDNDKDTVEVHYSQNKNNKSRKSKKIFPHKRTQMSFWADKVAKKILDAHNSRTIKNAMRSLRHFTTKFMGIKHYHTMKKIGKSLGIYSGSDIKKLGIDARNQIILRDFIIPKITRRLFERLTRLQKLAIISAFRRQLVPQSGPNNNQITQSRTIPSSKTSVTPP